jgi:AhpD family alkylhydroperoxidase
MTSITAQPKTRFSMVEQARDAYRGMAGFDRSIELDPTLRELVKIRASQINGCAFCIDMHTHDARKAGETDRRMHAVASWQESPLFSARERAALALTDAVTLISEGGVSDELYEQVAAEFDPPDLAQLIMAIAAINSWNRIAISTVMLYEPRAADG